MLSTKYPFAVRLIGFQPPEKLVIEEIFATQDEKGHAYFCLQEDNLQDPDIFLVNGDEGKALVALSYFEPSTLRPALIISSREIDPTYSRVSRPVNPGKLIYALNILVEKRASALAILEASDIVTVPERRRQDRFPDEKLTPADYIRMRRPQVNGGVLIIDKNIAFRNYVAELLAPHPLSVVYAHNEIAAIDQCRQQKISLAFINTSTPDIDSYRLCEKIKRQIVDRITVVFLVRNPSEYNQAFARNVGCDGYLEKPLSNKNLLTTLKKFHPALWH